MFTCRIGINKCPAQKSLERSEIQLLLARYEKEIIN